MWALIQYGWYSYEKRRLGHRHTRTEKRRCEDIYKAERETSEETLIPWYQVSSYQYQNCEKVNVSDLSPRACGICYGSPGKLVCYIFDYHGHNTPDFNPSPEKKKMHVLLLDRAAAPNPTKSPALENWARQWTARTYHQVASSQRWTGFLFQEWGAWGRVAEGAQLWSQAGLVSVPTVTLVAWESKSIPHRLLSCKIMILIFTPLLWPECLFPQIYLSKS